METQTSPAVRSFDATNIGNLATHAIKDAVAVCNRNLKALYQGHNGEVTCRRCLVMEISKEERRPMESVEQAVSRGVLKAFKANLKPGDVLEVVEHWHEPYVGMTRTVEKVQGNGYWFRQTNDPRRLWSEYPPASKVSIAGDGFRFDTEDPDRYWILEVRS